MGAQKYRGLHPETIAIHHGYRPELSEGAAVEPMFNSSTYIAKSAGALEKKFAAIRSGGKDLVYSRLGAPNVELLEDGYAAIFYGAVLREPDCVLTCSGMEAISLMLDVYLDPGDVVLYNQPLYGGTVIHLRWLESRYGISSKGFKSAEELGVLVDDSCTRAHVKMIYIESPTNPTLEEVDIEACAAHAHAAYEYQKKVFNATRPVLTVVDNTFLTPYFQRPLRLGADIEVHSATKYLGGHGDLVAGIVLGEKKFLQPIRKLRGQRGGVIDAERVHLLQRSLETLGPRMDIHSHNAARVATFLARHPKVSNVRFLGILPEGSLQYLIHQKQSCGHSGMISFEITDGLRAMRRFLDSLKLIMLAVSLGATHSLTCHPALTTHSGIPAPERKRMGLPDNFVRLSVGLEHPDDIIDDIAQALENV